MFGLIFLGVICAVVIYRVQLFSLNLSDHSYNQDFFYLSLGYVGIGLIFGFRKYIELALIKVKVLDKGLSFFSTHAFSIFLIHSLYIYLAETVLGLKGMSNVVDIGLKITFVLLASCLSAVPLSYISKKITNRLLAYIDSRSVKSKELSSI